MQVHPPQMLSLTNKGHQNNLNRKLKRPYAARLDFFWLCLRFCLRLETSRKACLRPRTDSHAELWRQAGTDLFYMSTQTKLIQLLLPSLIYFVWTCRSQFWPGKFLSWGQSVCYTDRKPPQQREFLLNSVLFYLTHESTCQSNFTV